MLCKIISVLYKAPSTWWNQQQDFCMYINQDYFFILALSSFTEKNQSQGYVLQFETGYSCEAE